ncbi:MAG: hypothetical protein WDM96_10855 [Lacunisphaera sp.]
MSSTTHSFDLTLNGKSVHVEGAAPTTTLLDWLRASGRTGSKCAAPRAIAARAPWPGGSRRRGPGHLPRDQQLHRTAAMFAAARW